MINDLRCTADSQFTCLVLARAQDRPVCSDHHTSYGLQPHCSSYSIVLWSLHGYMVTTTKYIFILMCLPQPQQQVAVFSSSPSNVMQQHSPVECGGLVMPGLLHCMPLYHIPVNYWAVPHGGRCYWICAVCDVTILRHTYVYKPTVWLSLLAKYAYYATGTLSWLL